MALIFFFHLKTRKNSQLFRRPKGLGCGVEWLAFRQRVCAVLLGGVAVALKRVGELA